MPEVFNVSGRGGKFINTPRGGRTRFRRAAAASQSGVTLSTQSDVQLAAVIVGDDPGSHGLHIDHPTHPPRFFADTTMTWVQDGDFFSASTWSLGRAPQSGDVLVLPKLVIDGTANTRLTTQILAVTDNGELNITVTDATKTFELVIPNIALNTTLDYQQFGNGFLGCGTGSITVLGATKTPFVRAGADIAAGATSLTFATAVSGWQVGDRLVIPDSRRVGPKTSHRYEIRSIATIAGDGLSCTLNSALTYAHPSCVDFDGNVLKRPHIMNLTRNVTVKSESRTGTRGHALFHGACGVDIRYMAFQNLGRTSNAATPVPSNGSSGSPASNQLGRYMGPHMHHHTGPTVAPSYGYQFRLKGCSVYDESNDDDVYRWGITLHGASYGLVQDNVLYGTAGAGIMEEDGSETANVIDGNCIFRSYGADGRGDERGLSNVGWEGAGIWSAAHVNTYTNNVVCSYGRYGHVLGFLGGTSTPYPTYPGASYLGAGWGTRNNRRTKVTSWSNNEFYGSMNTAISPWLIGATYDEAYANQEQSIIDGLVAWHFYKEGVWNYPVNNFRYANWLLYGIPSDLQSAADGTTGFFSDDYLTQDIEIYNCLFYALHTGVHLPTKFGDTRNTGIAESVPAIIENCTFRCVSNAVGKNLWANTGGSTGLPARQAYFRNCTMSQPFVTDPDWTGSIGQTNFAYLYTLDTPGLNLLELDEIKVFQHNGDNGDNFQVYYSEQIGTHVLPSQGLALQPLAAGKTNTQAWADHGVALAGAVLPGGATTRSRVYGKVNTIAAWPP